MIDESFLAFEEIINKMIKFNGEFYDEENGIHSYIYEIEIETPVELDISKSEDGKLMIGTVPPLYDIDTTIMPSLHKLKFIAERNL